MKMLIVLILKKLFSYMLNITCQPAVYHHNPKILVRSPLMKSVIDARTRWVPARVIKTVENNIQKGSR